MSEYVYVDNSNVFIEGQRASAVAQGMAVNIYDATDNRIVDFRYRMDFSRLHKFAAGDDPERIRRAMLFGSRPPHNGDLWSIARAAGFEVVVEDRSIGNREKKIDTGIAVAMIKDAYTLVERNQDTITLVAGDADYVPVVRTLVGDGCKVVVMFWDHASRELKSECSQFVNLNPYLAYLGHWSFPRAESQVVAAA